MEQIIFKGYTIEIEQEENPESPRLWDNLSTMICFHRRYDLGDKHNIQHQDYSSWQEMEQALIKQYKPVIIKPLYLFDYSGIAISTTDFNDRWDSGQVGFVFISRKMALECYGVKRISTDIKTRAESMLDAEVETYDQYLRSEVYGYQIKDSNGQMVDSCYGYYSVDHEICGLMDEARYFIDGELKKETTQQ